MFIKVKVAKGSSLGEVVVINASRITSIVPDYRTSGMSEVDLIGSKISLADGQNFEVVEDVEAVLKKIELASW